MHFFGLYCITGKVITMVSYKVLSQNGSGVLEENTQNIK